MPDTAIVIGAGPTGLMAAETISAAGIAVDLYDAMPTPGRKLLRAGIGGLNLTHAEPAESFVRRYGERQADIGRWLAAFGPAELRAWAAGLGIETFVGSSGRVFPVGMKAAPLLRAWLARLREQGVRLHARHRWQGWDAEGALAFATPDAERKVGADEATAQQGGRARNALLAAADDRTAVVLALGGGSWPRLGSDGAWLPWLQARGIATAPLRPANCGFDIDWSAHLRERWAGQPVKDVRASFAGESRQGEFVVTRHGIEGGPIYALSAALRDAIEREGRAVLMLDLAPGRSHERLVADLSRAQGRDSLANHLRRRAGIEGIKAALLREAGGIELPRDPARLAALIKALPLVLVAPRPLAEAISSAGGVRFAEFDDTLMLRQCPGTFVAGEMLDWEAPTGGYLLTACLASGRLAGQGAVAWLRG